MLNHCDSFCEPRGAGFRQYRLRVRLDRSQRKERMKPRACVITLSALPRGCGLLEYRPQRITDNQCPGRNRAAIPPRASPRRAVRAQYRARGRRPGVVPRYRESEHTEGTARSCSSRLLARAGRRDKKQRTWSLWRPRSCRTLRFPRGRAV
jgi:hypothetical protein